MYSRRNPWKKIFFGRKPNLKVNSAANTKIDIPAVR